MKKKISIEKKTKTKTIKYFDVKIKHNKLIDVINTGNDVMVFITLRKPFFRFLNYFNSKYKVIDNCYMAFNHKDKRLISIDDNVATPTKVSNSNLFPKRFYYLMSFNFRQYLQNNINRDITKINSFTLTTSINTDNLSIDNIIEMLQNIVLYIKQRVDITKYDLSYSFNLIDNQLKEVVTTLEGVGSND